MLKTIAVIVGVALLLFIGVCTYFVVGISSVYPPIKSYEYPKSIHQLENSMTALAAANKNISFKNTAITGTEARGYHYYFTVELKNAANDLEYKIVYDKANNWIKTNTTEIKLVGAFDKINKTGGYKYKDKGVKELATLFEKDFLYRLPDK